MVGFQYFGYYPNSKIHATLSYNIGHFPSFLSEAQKYPGSKPEVLAPGVVSKELRYEFGSVINKKGDELFIGLDPGDGNQILHSRLENGKWTEPQVIISHPIYGYNDPMLSNDEQRLYYISNQPLSGKGEQKDIDIWYSERTADGWSKPINAGDQINTEAEEYYISFTESGDMYFASNIGTGKSDFRNHDIYKSEFEKAISKTDQAAFDHQYGAL